MGKSVLEILGQQWQPPPQLDPPADPATEQPDLSALTPGAIVQLWLDRHTTAGESYTGILHASYSRFCDDNGLQPVGVRLFGTALWLAGYSGDKDRRGKLLPLALKRAVLPASAPRRPPPPADQTAEPRRPTLSTNLRRRGLIR